MIVKKTMFREENPAGTITVGIMLYGGTESIFFHEGETKLHLNKHCFAYVEENHPLALLPDGASVEGEIVRVDEDCIYEFDEDRKPTKVYSTYGYRADSSSELEHMTSSYSVLEKRNLR